MNAPFFKCVDVMLFLKNLFIEFYRINLIVIFEIGGDVAPLLSSKCHRGQEAEEHQVTCPEKQSHGVPYWQP